MTTRGGSRGSNGADGFVLRWLEDVDARSPVPLYEQIASRLKAAVGGGVLAAGDPLPSVRSLASELRINPATVAQAYRLLESEGFAEMRQGAGSFVATPAADQRRRERQAQARRLIRATLAEAARAGLTVAELEQALDEMTKERDR